MNSLTKVQAQPYRRDIDGLRALAVISVIGYHAFPNAVSGGYVGVDIFFVISGYLISSIILTNLNNGTFSLRTFYARRIRRIFPALSIVLLTCIASGWFLLMPDELRELGKHIAGGAGFASNFLLLNESGYFDTAAESKPLLHLWSLGIEEQFYLIWPALVLIAWRRLNIALLTIVVLFTSISANIYWVNEYAIEVFFLPITRLWELLLGGLLAVISSNRIHVETISKLHSFYININFSSTHRILLSILGLTLILYAVFFFDSTISFPGWWALTPTIGAALIIASGPNTIVSSYVLGRNVIVWIGLISYPLYLWHWPLLTFPKILQNGEITSYTTVIAIIMSIGLSVMTYYFVERPLRFGGKLYAKTFTLCVLMLAVGTIGIFINLNTDTKNNHNYNDILAKHNIHTDDVSSHNNENCSDSIHFPYNAINSDFFCMQSHSAETFSKNVIIGDSHAYPMYFGFYNLYVNQRNQSLQMLGANGCPPLIDLESYQKGSHDTCRILMNTLIHRLADDQGVHTVILVNRGPLYVSGSGFGNTDKHQRIVHRYISPGQESNSSAYKSALNETIEFLLMKKKNVILLITPPELGFEPKSCIPERIKYFQQRSLDECHIDYGKYMDRSKEYRVIISEIANKHEELVTLDPRAALCNSKFCRAFSNNYFLYSDNNHLSATGARIVVENVANQIPR